MQVQNVFTTVIIMYIYISEIHLSTYFIIRQKTTLKLFAHPMESMFNKTFIIATVLIRSII